MFISILCLTRFLPPYASDFVPVKLETGCTVEVDKKLEKERSRRLELHSWLSAWGNYALAGAALGQFPFASAMLHRAHVVEIALSAHRESKTCLLGVLYDELCRYVSHMG